MDKVFAWVTGQMQIIEIENTKQSAEKSCALKTFFFIMEI